MRIYNKMRIKSGQRIAVMQFLAACIISILIIRVMMDVEEHSRNKGSTRDNRDEKNKYMYK